MQAHRAAIAALLAGSLSATASGPATADATRFSILGLEVKLSHAAEWTNEAGERMWALGTLKGFERVEGSVGQLVATWGTAWIVHDEPVAADADAVRAWATVAVETITQRWENPRFLEVFVATKSWRSHVVRAFDLTEHRYESKKFPWYLRVVLRRKMHTEDGNRIHELGPWTVVDAWALDERQEQRPQSRPAGSSERRLIE